MKKTWYKSKIAFLLVLTLVVGFVGSKSAFFSKANEKTTYKEVTFKDWGIENGAYGNGVGYHLTDTAITSLDKVAFTGKITYNTASDFRIGGNSNVWAGLTFMVNNGHLYVSDETDNVGSDDILLENTTISKTEAFELRLTFDKGTTANEWTVGIYVDGEHKHDLTDTMDLGTAFLVNGADMKLEDVVKKEKPQEPTYKELTFKDWGIENGSYGNGTGYTLVDQTITSLDQTAFTGKFTYNGASDFRIGGNSNVWAGLAFMVSNGHLYVTDETDNVGGDDVLLENTTISKTEAFELRLTFEKGTKANEWTVGIYVNGEHKHDFTDTMDLGTAFLVNGAGMKLEDVVKEEKPQEPTYKELTFKDWGIENGSYGNGTGYTLVDQTITSLDQTAFTGKFTYNGASDFRIGGNSNVWAGLAFMVSNGHLYVTDETDTVGGDDILLENTTISKTEAFELRLTFDKGTKANEWTVGIYVNGEHKHDFTDTMDLGTAFLVNGAGMKLEDVVKEEKPQEPTVKTYKEVTFKDWEIENGVYDNGVGYHLTDTAITSLDKVAFTGKITYNTASDFRIGGNSNVWAGLTFMVSNGHLYVSDETDTVGGDDILLENTTISKTEAFELRLTFDKGTKANEWTVGIYVNGEHKHDFTDTMDLGTAFLVNGFGMVLEDVVKGDTNTPTGPDDTDKPDTTTKPDTSRKYKEYTFSDWGIIDGEYITAQAYTMANGRSNLNGVSFRGKFDFSSGNGNMRIAGKENAWAGILVGARTNQLVLDCEVDGFSTLDNFITYTKKDLAKEQFELRLTFDCMKNGNLEVGVWIDGNFQKYLIYEGMASSIGTKILFDGNGIILQDVGKENETDKNPTKEKLPKGFQKVTFDSFGVLNGTYRFNKNDLSARGQYSSSLDKTIFSGDIYFDSKKMVDFRYGGLTTDWYGLIFSTTQDGRLYMQGIADNKIVTDTYIFNPTKANTKLTGAWFNLKLSTEIVDCDGDGKKDDVKLGVWFNDVLYNNQYIELKDYAQYLGRMLSAFVREDGGIIKIRSDAKVQSDNAYKPDTSRKYKEYTFSDWGIIDGEYIAAQEYITEAGLTSLNGVSFRGKFDFSSGSGNMRIGGKENVWAGILVGVRTNQLVLDCEVDGFSTLDNFITYTKKDLAKEPFELRLTFDYMKNGNLEVGVWIDGNFQKYLIYEGMAKSVGAKILFDGNGIVLQDVGKTDDQNTDTTPKKLPKEFKEITFKSFGVEDGTYTFNNNDLTARGKYLFSLDKTIFSGDMYFDSKKLVDFRYGGLTTDWFGLIFTNTQDGRLYMQGIADNKVVTDTYIFNPTKAKTKLTDAWFNLKLSTEIVDCDGDGKKDDVKLGVWFNGVLYNNQYIELKDYAQYLGNMISVFVREEGGMFKLKSDVKVDTGVDFSLFGFTKNWDAELGE